MHGDRDSSPRLAAFCFVLLLLTCVSPASGQRTVTVEAMGRISSDRFFAFTKVVATDTLLAAGPLLHPGGVDLFRWDGARVGTIDSLLTPNPNGGIAWYGDTLLVFDPESESLRSLSLRRAQQWERYVPKAITYHLRRSGLVVFAVHQRSPERFGNPWHSIDPTGIWRSFGYDELDTLRTGTPWLYEWKVAHVAPEEGQVWTHHRDRLRIDSWTEGGRHLRTIRDDPDWTRPRTDRSFLLGPALHAVYVDRDLIWIIGHPIDDGWAEALPPDWDGRAQSISVENDLLDTVVEARSRMTGELIASVRLDRVIRGFAGRNLVFDLTEVDDDSVAAVVWRLNITQ